MYGNYYGNNYGGYQGGYQNNQNNQNGYQNNQGGYQGNYQGNYQGGNQGNYQGGAMDYTVDMVFCIDATGSMEDTTGSQQKIINMVKQNALNFYNDFGQIMSAKSKKVRQLRVRVVAFRDYRADGKNAMLVTDFFLLPQQAKEFEMCINGIHAEGGGDIPEDGLEALAYAIKSKWTTEGAKKRQVIVIWTDAGAHDLGYGRTSEFYPNGMPSTLAELSDWWDGMNFNSKRLVMFAPDENGWSYISRNWDNVVHVPSAAGNGLAEQSFGEILNAIANSV